MKEYSFRNNSFKSAKWIARQKAKKKAFIEGQVFIDKDGLHNPLKFKNLNIQAT